jgi:prophage regulatory protein
MKLNQGAIDRDPNRVISTGELTALLGVNVVTIWRWCRAGRFPAPIKLGIRRNGWRADEISAWLAARPKANYGGDRSAA